MEILAAAGQGLTSVFQPQAFLLMMLGVVLGNIVGFIPGIGGNFYLSILIPFTFGMDPVLGFALLLGGHAVSATGGSISSILFNTPGDGPNAPTCLDGFPLTQQGKAGKALGAALWSSGLGGVIGAAFLAFSIPLVRPLVLSFGPPEFLMLTLLGIAFISVLGGRKPLRGLMAGLFGLLLSLVGQDPSTGIVRFAFGQLYLWDGIKQVPLVVGLFAVAEMISLGVKGGTLARGDVRTVKTLWRDVWEGIRDTHRNWWLMAKCSLIGSVIGFLPGLGGQAAAFFTYGYAMRTSKHPETFGHGNIEGVIGPEAANNAKEGGALIPTIAFGVPGSSSMAILLGAFLILGLTPGPKMLTEHLPLVFSMVWTLAIANIVGAILCLLFAAQMARITFVKSAVVIPLILLFAVLGSYTSTNSLGDLVTTLVFGVLGYFMQQYEFPKAPLVLGFVLGEIAEVNLHLSYTLFGMAFLLRPITMVLTILLVLSLLSPVLGYVRARRKAVAA